MATENSTTAADAELPLSNIPISRIEAALYAGYELESMAASFPEFSTTGHIDLTAEHLHNLIKSRIKVLASVVISALDDDRGTNELRHVVGLSEVNHG